MRTLDYTDEALRALEDIAAYIADESHDRTMARSFARTIEAGCERLNSLPGTLGTARPDLAPDLRSTPHRGYVIYFRYLADTLQIVTVLHAGRDAVAYFAPDDMM